MTIIMTMVMIETMAHTVPDEKLNTSKKMTRKGGSRKNYNSRQVRWMGRNHYADI